MQGSEIHVFNETTGSKRLWIGLLAVIASSAAFARMLVGVQPGVAAFSVLIIAHGLVLVLWVAAERLDTSDDILAPLFVVVLAFVIHFVGPAFYNLLVARIPTEINAYLLAHLSIGAFLVCFSLGYFLWGRAQVKAERPTSRVFYDGRVVFAFSVVFALTSLAAAGYFIRLSGGLLNHLAGLGLRLGLFQGQGVMLSLMTLSVPSTLLAYVVFARSRSLVALAWFLMAAGIALFTGVMSGSRGVLVALFLAIVVSRHYLVRRISVGGATVLLVVVATFLVAFIALVRQPSLGEDFAKLDGVAEVGEKLMVTLYGKGTFKELNSVARVHESVPSDVTFMNGKTFLAAATFPIPRSILPGKLPGGSEVFTREIRPEIWAAGRGDRVTIIGELYMNFGWFGIVVGSFLIGALTRTMFAWRMRNENQPLLILVYAVGLVSLVALIRGDFAIASFQFIRFFLPLYLVYLICRWKVLGASHPTAAAH